MPERVLAEIAPLHREAFYKDLLAWYEGHKRPLPWRNTRDPYAIWVSEVMLQQTRVNQALPYYQRFMAAFPTVQSLADADLDAVLRAWEGLGYYARARNLHKAARLVRDRFAGEVPDCRPQLRALPGIGSYTAGAILSIAFRKPVAAVDANAHRVLARVFAQSDIKAVRQLAEVLVPPQAPGAFNQALMELGSAVCTPRAPVCSACPLRQPCRALAMDAADRFPPRKRKAAIPHYDVAAGMILDGKGRLLVQRRDETGLLGGLWELPGGKCEPGETVESACSRELLEELGIDVEVGKRTHVVAHAYSHFRITLHVFPCRIHSGEPASSRPLRWVLPSELEDLAFPRATRRVLDAWVQGAGTRSA